MDDFNDDLHALIQSGSSSLATNGSETTSIIPTPVPPVLGSSDPFYMHEVIDNPFLFPDLDWIFKPLNSTDPLDEPTPPILPIISTTTTSTVTTIINSSSSYSTHAGRSDAKPMKAKTKKKKKEKQVLSLEERFRRASLRKYHRKTWIVHEVGGDGLNDFDDRWAWIMYGQKTLKNCAFPRRYYKCSTSASCFAVKQVEQTSEYPEEIKFTVKYSGSHNHPPPNPLKISPLVSRHCSKKGKSITNNNVSTTSSNSVHNSGGNNALAPAQPSSDHHSPFSIMSSSQGDGSDMVVNTSEAEELELLLVDEDQLVDGSENNNVGYLDDEFFEGIDDELRLRDKFFHG